jgi:predicted hydrocarbon binding protein
MSVDVIRPTLGPLMSLTCFHYLRHGAEDNAGRALVVAAGRQRGQDLVEALGLHGASQDAQIICQKLAAALGLDGTRLCLVHSVVANANGGYEIRISEGACTAGVTSDEPYCAFTMGVFIGAIGAITGRRMLGRETACSAMGSPECVYQIDPIT